MIDDTAFRRRVRSFYRLHGRRDLPWRQPEPNGRFDPYKILVSEIMLQQTQVGRVAPKFLAFIDRFPDVAAMARAPLGEVLRAWSGLGYNRRAQFLHQASRQIIQSFGGVFPSQTSDLVKLPGIGPNTAGAIAAYAFNEPAVFVETNIRTVYLYHFFAGQTAVSDRVILEAAAKTLPKADYRSWYWALMDYGTYLKQTVGNPNRASRGYTKQSPFSGSRRQIRGQVIRSLSEQPHTLAELSSSINDERLSGVLDELRGEGLIKRTGGRFRL